MSIFHRAGNTADFGRRDVIAIEEAVECLPSPASWRFGAASYELRVNILVLRKALPALVQVECYENSDYFQALSCF